MNNISIHTLETRDNVMLELMESYFNLDSEEIFTEIQNLLTETKNILKKKSVIYEELKTTLIPSLNKKELTLVFDRIKIDSMNYGEEVYKQIIPLLKNKNSTHSLLSGDYIGNGINQDLLHSILKKTIVLEKALNYQSSNQFYLVYINNLSNDSYETLIQGLSTYMPYVGYCDTTFSSSFKEIISFSLVNTYIVYKNFFICEHDEGYSDDDNINLKGYNFEKFGYTCKSIRSELFDLFLSYKIERPVYSNFEKDTQFSLNAITKNVLPLNEFDIIIDDEKFQYLKNNKNGSMKKSEIIDFKKSELVSLIKNKIFSNYIYNLSYLKEHKTKKFNIIIERKNKRLLVALEYIPTKKTLRVITLY